MNVRGLPDAVQRRGLPSWASRLFVFTAVLTVLFGCGKSGVPGPSPAGQGTSTVTVISAGEVAQWVRTARGKTAVVTLWATWCPPCVAEMPELDTFYRKADPARTALLAVSMDDPARIASVVVPFVERHALGFTVRVLDGATPDALGEALGIDFSGAVPVTLLFSPDGTLAKVWEGEVTAAMLQAAAPGIVL